MERDVEKNDVDVSALFKWNKKVIISDVMAGINISIFLRLVGDADLSRARAYGYRKSGELRKTLKSKDSDERQAMIADLEDFSDKDFLVKAILLLRVQDYYQIALKSIELKEPREPEADDQEKWEIYQQEVDAFPEKYAEALNKYLDELKSSDEKLMRKKPIEELYKIYEGEVINRLCQEKMNNAFSDMCIYLATFKDEKFTKRVFKSFEEFENCHPVLKTKLRDEYRGLELGTDLLKKLPGVMG